MHGEISLAGRLGQEGQQAAAECHPHHLLDPKHLQKFQVSAENPHPRDRAFGHHINVHG